MLPGNIASGLRELAEALQAQFFGRGEAGHLPPSGTEQGAFSSPTSLVARPPEALAKAGDE